ncbi:TPA: restriction endonuclease subunit S [Escherichia coli]|uniref:Restriction endonuclease subunit S n=4 Tax=Enterobacteriaceae TaxID=543 RepID=A0AAP8HZ43_ECOLX|nr:restriction endonuclease subunit S [Escherichia coli]EEZ9022722.1 restriction endonuclease subunit S [Escherichia coli O136]EEW1988310.1 restriction endonuclease subunit S [Escherichia coli]EEW2143953.1 restriction endonuclease subunit S [Escherichia coli]EFA5771983.1 restriction endonuclease subunit S [Escherichia coli]EFC6879710.1 restriction endonuclease subunit S [Escherichia coli]
MIPKGWSSQKLSSVASIIDCKHRTPEYVKSGIPLVSPGTIKWGALDLISPVKRVTEEEYRSLMDHCVVEQGDLVMSRNQSVGVVSYVDSKKPFVLGQDTVLIKAIHADWRFIYYTLQSDLVQRQIAKSAGGSTFSRINLSDIRALNIKTPAICEQDKISQILTAWDKAISVTEKLLTNSQQQKKALMQQLLTGKKRLLDENGVRFSGEWEKGKFCDMANIDTGYAFKSKDFTQSDSGIPIIRMSDFKTGGLDVLGAAKVDRDSVNGLDKFKLRVGDFVFGMSGSLNNYGRVEKKDLPCYLNQRVGRILAKECANQAFITYLYLSDSIQQSILNKAAGAAQLNISISDLRSMVVYYPCIEEQQKIAAVLSAADAEISTLEKKLACLRDEKKALMQQLLTGKRRVKVDEAVAE